MTNQSAYVDWSSIVCKSFGSARRWNLLSKKYRTPGNTIRIKRRMIDIEENMVTKYNQNQNTTYIFSFNIFNGNIQRWSVLIMKAENIFNIYDILNINSYLTISPDGPNRLNVHLVIFGNVLAIGSTRSE